MRSRIDSLDPVDLVHLVLGDDLEPSRGVGQVDLALRGLSGLGRSLFGGLFIAFRSGRGGLLVLVLDVLGGLHVLTPALFTGLADGLGSVVLERLALQGDGAGPPAANVQREQR
jgi:hypothetical protein